MGATAWRAVSCYYRRPAKPNSNLKFRSYLKAKNHSLTGSYLEKLVCWGTQASRSEVTPFIPTDSEQNKGDDSEKGDNEEVQSNNESNRDKESEEEKDRPERFIDLDVEMLNDIALWPTTLTDLMIDYIIRKKPNNIEFKVSEFFQYLTFSTLQPMGPQTFTARGHQLN
ncbi:hypothetical protein NPIL_24941 [Nephila pilipes]|uniref:Uncharacterized protein n=1 Tax=Nephila pilipes TaxID=299642 RepID=A0A8X6PQK1_NEPPI|nr:hypothetical protein NPIL_24941 [Nephila pilipes]